jgi:hypothetical protein|tara:strand:+ start:1564 stop:1911 length:348 start_codon:yes stop_codon:yes gene_type:complete
MKSFGKYRSWNVWNVTLWMDNDETNYRLGRSVVEHVIRNWDKNRLHGKVYSNQEKIDIATSRLFRYMNDWRSGKLEKTPDGASFNRISLRTWVEEQFEDVEESEEYKKCERLGLV